MVAFFKWAAIEHIKAKFYKNLEDLKNYMTKTAGFPSWMFAAHLYYPFFTAIRKIKGVCGVTRPSRRHHRRRRTSTASRRSRRAPVATTFGAGPTDPRPDRSLSSEELQRPRPWPRMPWRCSTN